MTIRRDEKVGLSFAGAGVGIIGVAIVLGLTTDGGGLDWVGIVTALAGVVMMLTGLFQFFRGGRPHTA